MTGNLAESIVHRLRHSRVVLADLTDRNPNVFYELGVRHSLKKGTILAAQGAQHVPSDLKGYWFLVYSTGLKAADDFRKQIKDILNQIEKSPERSDNPVADYLDKEQITISTHLQRANVKQLSALFTELTGNLFALNELTSSGVGNHFIFYDSLKLLCQTRYIDVGPDWFTVAYELLYTLRQIECGDRSDSTIASARTDASLFADHIKELIDKVSAGDFIEPQTVSHMVWRPRPMNEVSQKVNGVARFPVLLDGVSPLRTETLDVLTQFTASAARFFETRESLHPLRAMT